MNSGSAVDWRPIELGQARQWAALLAAIEAADHEHEHYDERDLAELFADDDRDFPSGSTAAWHGADMVAYAWLRPRSSANPAHVMRSEGGVHPQFRGRGLGRRLLSWADQAALPLHDARFPGRPLILEAARSSRNTAAIGLYGAHGYQQARWFHEMTTELAGPRPEAAIPEGVEIAVFSPERSADGLAVRRDAFRDHWGSVEMSAASWDRLTGQAAFRPQLSFVAYDGGRPAGAILAEEWVADTAATGRRDLYVPMVGTCRGARGRGIASALLATLLAAGARAGFDTASLAVDADSPTGAVALYERAGFAVVDTSIALHKQLPA
jgi:mycothiol synthase